jgi:catechol 2,3-dioxygenase-like lactoylglutathione lyase family enzyme
MLLNLSQIGQIALGVGDVDQAEAFYEGKLGLRKIYASSIAPGCD